MGWKSDLLELPLGMAAALSGGAARQPAEPNSIFILRNNDIGDLLVSTPLFEALRTRFPAARIVAGIGDWNRPILQNNPYVTEVLSVNAPWMNKYSASSHLTEMARGSIGYIYGSAEARELASRRFDIGIDVFGTQFGSLLLMRAGIPYRLGVRGFRGGHTAAQACVAFDPLEHVSRANLRFAELLGAYDLPEARPQLFLTREERATAAEIWDSAPSAANAERPIRIVVGHGAGLAEKAWPLDNYILLVSELYRLGNVSVIAVGGKDQLGDCARIAAVARYATTVATAQTLRETFALVADADLVICNSSMLLHVAAAFHVPTVLLLGPSIDSASVHHATWGYRSGCITLGRDAGRETIADPAKALQAAAKLLAETRCLARSPS